MIFVVNCVTEPVSKGKPFSTWLGELNHPDEKRAAAAEMALRHMGTNAIPYLLPKLTASESSVEEALQTNCRTERERTGAVLAFRILGSSAAQALPELGTLLTNAAAATNIGVANAIAQATAGVGEQAKPQLVGALNHPSPNIRRACLSGLIDLGENARDAMPSIMERLNDSDAETRGLALFFVSDVSEDREFKVRVFSEASQDPDHHVRSFARRELDRLKSN